MDELIEELGANHEVEQIGELCQIKDNRIVPGFFKSGQQIFPIIDKFHILYSIYPNQFFLYFLKQSLKAITSPNLATFVADIWDPVYSQCSVLVESIEHKNIKLKEVHKVYEYIRKKDDIKFQLHRLYLALERCQNRTPSSVAPQWISDCIIHMNCYLSLCRQSDAAKLILELKSKLGLFGDFSLVERVEKQVTSASDEPLSSIDKTLVDSALSFFKELSSNPEKYECILAFSKCGDIVEWIQKETEGVYFVVGDIFSTFLKSIHTAMVFKCYLLCLKDPFILWSHFGIIIILLLQR